VGISDPLPPPFFAGVDSTYFLPSPCFQKSRENNNTFLSGQIKQHHHIDKNPPLDIRNTKRVSERVGNMKKKSETKGEQRQRKHTNSLSASAPLLLL